MIKQRGQHFKNQKNFSITVFRLTRIHLGLITIWECPGGKLFIEK